MTRSIVCSALLLTGYSNAAYLIQPVDLGGNQESVHWEYSELYRPLSNANPTGTPTSGTGTIVPISPGYRASAGYYAFTGNFGLTATTQSIVISDIQSVVFQRVSMANPDYSLDLNLNWDGTLLPGTETASASYQTAPAIAIGGPWLSYYDASDTLLGKIAPTVTGILGSVYDPDAFIPGTYYNFVYQWDLSGVPEDVASVRIDAPIIAHASTVEARIDISDSYIQVIPEPAGTGLMSIGLAGLLIRRRR